MMGGEKGANRSVEVVGVDGRCVDVAAANFDERFLAACRIVEPSSFRNRNHRVFGAVQKENRRPDAIDRW